MNKLNIPSTITLKKDRITANCTSDGNGLIPPEVRADINNYSNDSLINAHIVDDEKIINNYATEPDISLAYYPYPKQQKGYTLLGIGATLPLSH